MQDITKDKPKLIALYLPQFHAIPENDKWWGKGFTEWVSVKKAKPLFPGHKQPKEPTELGYYDLSTDKVMEKQIKLAQEYGIHGFCFYHYWFSGKKLLEKPLENFLKNKKLNMPFCLCWANEPWKKRWYSPGHEILMKQEYGEKEDWIKHFNYLLPFLKDERAIKVDGKPVILFHNLKKNNYDSYEGNNYFQVEDKLIEMIKVFREEAKKNGLSGIYVVGPTIQIATAKDETTKKINIISQFNFDAVYDQAPWTLIFPVDKRTLAFPPPTNPNQAGEELLSNFGPLLFHYDDACQRILAQPKLHKIHFKGVFPAWDNTPRHLKNGSVFSDATPEKYYSFLKETILSIKNEPCDKQIIFINAWNEWGEGTYLEPDKENGRKYLEATKKALEETDLDKTTKS